jgi:predicted dehydrogenase
MKALILGCSSIARRRALPALKSLDRITAIDAASHRGTGVAADFTHYGGKAYGNYGQAIEGSDAGLVYVTSENSAHGGWAEAALAAGRHVIVDKPAFEDAATTQRLINRAAADGLVLAEATMFLDHPRIEALSELLGNTRGVELVQACFTFPALEPDNFRYDQARGGGAINDLGPYAAATCRYFFPVEPEQVACAVLSRAKGGGVETAIAVTATFPGGGSFLGHYGFGAEYQNWVSATGDGIAVRLDRFCTPPADAALVIGVRLENQESSLETPAGNCFALLFDRVLDCIAAGGAPELFDAMLRDAGFRDRLRDVA